MLSDSEEMKADRNQAKTSGNNANDFNLGESEINLALSKMMDSLKTAEFAEFSDMEEFKNEEIDDSGELEALVENLTELVKREETEMSGDEGEMFTEENIADIGQKSEITVEAEPEEAYTEHEMCNEEVNADTEYEAEAESEGDDAEAEYEEYDAEAESEGDDAEAEYEEYETEDVYEEYEDFETEEAYEEYEEYEESEGESSQDYSEFSEELASLMAYAGLKEGEDGGLIEELLRDGDEGQDSLFAEQDGTYGVPDYAAAYGDGLSYDAEAYGDETSYDAEVYGDEILYDAEAYGYDAETYGDETSYGAEAYADESGYGAETYGDETSYGAEAYADEPEDENSYEIDFDDDDWFGDPKEAAKADAEELRAVLEQEEEARKDEQPVTLPVEEKISRKERKRKEAIRKAEEKTEKKRAKLTAKTQARADKQNRKKKKDVVQDADVDEDITLIDMDEEWKPGGVGVRVKRSHFWPIFFGTILVLLIAAVVAGYILVRKPHNDVYHQYEALIDEYNTQLTAYNEAAKTYNEKAVVCIDANEALDEAISEAEAVVNNGQEAFDEELRKTLAQSLNAAKNDRAEDVEKAEQRTPLAADKILNRIYVTADQVEPEVTAMQEMLDELTATTDKMNDLSKTMVQTSYDTVIASLQEQTALLDESCEMMLQLISPQEFFVEERLKEAESITRSRQVTQEHDPEGLLNADAGCTRCLYFCTPLLKTQDLTDFDLVETGVKAGGSVEIYDTVEQAKARDGNITAADTKAHQDWEDAVAKAEEEKKAAEEQNPTAAQTEAAEEELPEEPVATVHYRYGSMVFRFSPDLSEKQVEQLKTEMLNALTRIEEAQ